jgi:hypothetical protein
MRRSSQLKDNPAERRSAMNYATIIAALGLSLSASAAHAKPKVHVWPELGVESSITFPNYGAIRNFEADGDKGIWIEDQQRRWYYGEFLGRCQGLNFAQAIGFDTGGLSRFDKFSKIIVRDDVCQLNSFVTAEKPLPRKERKRLAKEAAAKAKAEAAN